MEILSDIVNNRCLWIPFFLWLSIQLFKFFYEWFVNKKINFHRLLGAGGMPSSHSAVVCSLAALTGREVGYGSAEFAMAVILALIVMYDACGVRRAAGKQASILNKLISTPGLTNLEIQEKLTEALGHSPKQVFVGALIGIIIGTFI
ncbi:MAG: divergent PAP2 family protein [Clostridia bacterium]|nr:divergent PAP2 family protein [Clostridia bacterium]